MDHAHMGHGDMDMGEGQCSMNMLFTWSSKNLCIIFPQWRVTGTHSFILSLLAIVLLTAGYECVREISRRYEQIHKARMAAYSTSASSEDTQVNESNSLLVVGRESKAAAERQGTIIKAALYAVQVFYSFFIMLLFMTYNGWVMLAVAVGAFIGYLTFGDNLTSTKSVACH
ncbi:copper transpport protein [Exophiala dermatitidis]|uniref:Copper transport protein n=2 Tax=Exophiala dermatitidis TaxID=5970 RepID=H6C657_EXODN|nr:uncharacterized protein HMPREF1120_07198 [Exophiala dermatitidis NIH/UT8656]KAJ4526334.1 copper transpport protein [Exophiala dermatitidis]EHY59202.1 hypothetical protein HMPREF1120_07198 [Exophiala dermatitidis NIH/UT8656]KAJ4526723.1 copper transpport protein [Exophiala dermatitidis]KAJ4532427.1 copper transpport protein [Exophiala dermatitidis]KAJ4573575.1 copper transpport protein [Exophiala dermatitidis]